MTKQSAKEAPGAGARGPQKGRADGVSMVHRLSACLTDAVTIRDVAAAVRKPLQADRVVLVQLESDRMLVTALDPPEPSVWPEIWRSEWYSEWPDDAASAALPTLRAVLRSGDPALWPRGSELEPGLAGIGPGGLAVLPLCVNGHVVGACLTGWVEPRAFSPDEQAALTAAADLIGQALVRVHAFDARYELATMLQHSLLPRTPPRPPGGVAVARYLPATVGLEVGGDWYDVIPLDESRIALVIGDVQGHSAAAATVMGQMRTAIRAYAVEGHPPDVVMSRANRLLVGMGSDLFATCCYAALDMAEGTGWLVRAGHTPPLLRQPDGSTEEITIESGPPLGVVADADFPMAGLSLATGSLLALLTDGLVESKSRPLEEGLWNLRAALSAVDPGDAERAADQLLGGAHRRDDDVALLLLRYDGMEVRPVRVGWTVWRLPDAVMHARRFTTRTLRSWRVAHELDTVLLVVSELVTNALVHTQGPVHLDLTLTGDRLRVVVGDASPRAPAKPMTIDWEATGGRGLFLVEAMADHWGSVPVSGGKHVWAEVGVTAPETSGEGAQPGREGEALT